jgi:hypothetical protein
MITEVDGRFNKEEAQNALDAFKEIFDAMKGKMLNNFIGHANDIFLFLESAKRAAPEKKVKKS